MGPNTRLEKFMTKLAPQPERIKQLMLEPQFQNMFRTIKRACKAAEEEGYVAGEYDDFEPSALHKAQVESCEDQLTAKGYTEVEIYTAFAVIDSLSEPDDSG
jgi:hypothetical protein